MSFTIEPKLLWVVIPIFLAWNVLNLNNPVMKVFLEWLSVHLQSWLEQRWCALASTGGSGGQARSGGKKESVGEKKESVGESDEESDDEREKKREWRRRWPVVVEEDEEEEEEEEERRPDSPDNGPFAKFKDTLGSWLATLRHWRGLRRERDLERGRSRSSSPAARQSQTQTTQVDARGGPSPGDLNAILSGLLQTMAGVDPTGGQS
ncbi:hypothetical protein ANOM_011629 [Aspergillus nomiae NRRL 13137]|uniref:Uncharacterized protein n=1 Tax=Aspergillus nomiae NRRL (strain ATCC 15546 / NRRL 13137 / CBS 260.88 / M93) TaxID=1509407 RepID=A0A0L1IL33_ASPN3|nr:uncharacterized protein ANOM_011629 [Aspergillus nomiae NRRL 13137]KNG79898.1 hypothetical protein ANOM_011629 [Aspergillus nomiae NRRL 13137]